MACIVNCIYCRFNLCLNSSLTSHPQFPGGPYTMAVLVKIGTIRSVAHLVGRAVPCPPQVVSRPDWHDRRARLPALSGIQPGGSDAPCLSHGLFLCAPKLWQFMLTLAHFIASGTPPSCGSKPAQFNILPDKSGVPAETMRLDFLQYQGAPNEVGMLRQNAGSGTFIHTFRASMTDRDCLQSVLIVP